MCAAAPSNVTPAEMIQPIKPAERRVNANLCELISCVGGGQGGARRMHVSEWCWRGHDAVGPRLCVFILRNPTCARVTLFL